MGPQYALWMRCSTLAKKSYATKTCHILCNQQIIWLAHFISWWTQGWTFYCNGNVCGRAYGSNAQHLQEILCHYNLADFVQPTFIWLANIVMWLTNDWTFWYTGNGCMQPCLWIRCSTLARNLMLLQLAKQFVISTCLIGIS